MRSLLAVMAPLRPRPGSRRRAQRRDPADEPRHPAHQGEVVRGAGLRLRLRVRPGQPVRDGRDVRDGRRRALPLLRPRRHLLEPRQQHRAEQPQLGLLLPAHQGRPHGRAAARAAARRRGRCPTSARGCAATWPATTRTCATPASTGCPTRAAAGRRGCGRSPRSTPSGASTSWRCWPARASRSTGSAVPSRPARAPCRSRRRRLPELPDLPLGDLGSNAVALGKSATSDRHGLLLGNPHFPWDGPERFYQAQLTIPGKLDVSGASLYGIPIVLIGHTRNLAWSHTVSTAFRFTPYELKLVPGAPTTVPRRRPAARDARPHRDGAGAQARRVARAALAHAVHDRTSGRCSPRSSASPCSRGRRPRRTRWATPTRATSACSTTSSRSTRRRAPVSWTRSSAATRGSRGSTRSPPTPPGRPTTPTSAPSRT